MNEKNFSIWNGTDHNCLLFNQEQIYKVRKSKWVIKTPEAKAEYEKNVDKTLNILQRQSIKRYSPTLDSRRLIQTHEDFYPIQIELPSDERDITIVSARYFYGVLHGSRWRFYLDKLYIPQPVYSSDPNRGPAQIVGCFLVKAMAPLTPSEYVWAINQNMSVSTAGLQACLAYYKQEEKRYEDAKYNPQFFHNLDVVNTQLYHQLAINQSLPDFMFPTPISSAMINPEPFNQRMGAVTFWA